MRYVRTDSREDDDASEPLDGFAYRGDRLCAVVETKARNMTLRYLFVEQSGEWLITARKLQQGREWAMERGVPFVGVLYLVPSRRVLVTRLCDPDGTWTVQWRTAETWTRETCATNRRVLRVNAYVDLRTPNCHHIDLDGRSAFIDRASTIAAR